MLAFFKPMGVLRNLLHGLGVALMIILPFSEPTWNPQGTDVILGAAIPALAPIVVIVIMFDVLMSKVMLSDAEDIEEKRHFANIVKTNLAVAFSLLAIWMTTFWDALFN